MFTISAMHNTAVVYAEARYRIEPSVTFSSVKADEVSATSVSPGVVNAISIMLAEIKK